MNEGQKQKRIGPQGTSQVSNFLLTATLVTILTKCKIPKWGFSGARK